MKKVTVIGHFDWKTNSMIGAVVKSRSINDQLINEFGRKTIDNVDIFLWKRHFLPVFFKILFKFLGSKNIVLIISDTSAALLTFLSFLKRINKANVLYCVVGGSIANTLSTRPKSMKKMRFVDNIFVETKKCQSEMRNIGFNNTYILRNFKSFKSFKEHQPFSKDELHLCTFSRVNYDKGITDAINCVQEINCKHGHKCFLDIYGIIDEDYREEFASLLSNKKNVCYRGVVGSNSSIDILSNYDCLLFPTRFDGEGMPGTIIDAFASGTPVLCSDWEYRSEMIEDGVHGFVFKYKDYSSLVETVEKMLHNMDKLPTFGDNCKKEYEKYTPRKSIEPLLEKIK